MIVYNEDCLDVLKRIDDNSVDSVVTDPPYGLKLLGHSWDYNLPSIDIWRECLRVLKPGGHLLSFSSARTYHRMAISIEDAGFEIRDQIMWVYGQGMPKGKNLKPAHEPICVARKPFKGSAKANVAAHGTGNLNVDDCRVPCNQDDKPTFPEGEYSTDTIVGSIRPETRTADPDPSTRWPANIIHDGSDPVVEMFPEKAGALFTATRKKATTGGSGNSLMGKAREVGEGNGAVDAPGSAARFFWCAKPSRTERAEASKHPTVKPIKLMTYLVKLATPKGGTVVDPFMGSGTTGVAAAIEGFDFIGCELEPEYFEIATKRLNIT